MIAGIGGGGPLFPVGCKKCSRFEPDSGGKFPIPWEKKVLACSDLCSSAMRNRCCGSVTSRQGSLVGKGG